MLKPDLAWLLRLPKKGGFRARESMGDCCYLRMGHTPELVLAGNARREIVEINKES